MNLSYKESILLPLELYNLCYIYDNKNLIKLSEKKDFIFFNRIKPGDPPSHLFALKPKIISPKSPPDSVNQNEIDSISKMFPLRKQPIVRSILDILLQYPKVIKWDHHMRVTLYEDDFLIDSNLIDLLLHVVGVNEEHTPPHLEAFLTILLNLNVPKQWLAPNIFPAQTKPKSIRKVKRKLQKDILQQYEDIIKPAKLKLQETSHKKVKVKADPGDFTAVMSESPRVPKLTRKYEGLHIDTERKTPYIPQEGSDIDGDDNEHTPYMLRRIRPQQWYSHPKSYLRGGRGDRDEENTSQGDDIEHQMGSGFVNHHFPPNNWIVL
jgi:hypothetical protein